MGEEEAERFEMRVKPKPRTGRPASVGTGSGGPKDGGGYDWGWPAREMTAANVALATRLRDGGFVGCAYGLLRAGGPPFVALLGEEAGGMRSALDLMRGWVDAAGHNAVSVEILFDGSGYVISLGQQPDLMRWRLRGIDPDEDALLLGLNVLKRLDTRHPFLDELAEYCRQPVAPVCLMVACASRRGGGKSGGIDATAVAPLDDGLMLPGIGVYAGIADRPATSAARLEGEMRIASERGRPPGPAIDPAAVMERRERRLLASVPKTIHVLRHQGRGRELVAACAASGCARWQAEQAIANLRSADRFAYRPRGASKRSTMLAALSDALVEPASDPFDVDRMPHEAVMAQASLDARFLLRRVDPDRPPGEGWAQVNARLAELGYA